MKSHGGYYPAFAVLAMVLTHMHGAFAARATSNQANRKRSGESSLLCSGSFSLSPLSLLVRVFFFLRMNEPPSSTCVHVRAPLVAVSFLLPFVLFSAQTEPADCRICHVPLSLFSSSSSFSSRYQKYLGDIRCISCAVYYLFHVYL